MVGGSRAKRITLRPSRWTDFACAWVRLREISRLPMAQVQSCSPGEFGKRLKDHLPLSGFADRFVAKGKFSSRLASMPVKLITHPEPGLLGAAAAYAQKLR